MNGNLVISLDFELLWGIFDNVDPFQKEVYFQDIKNIIPQVLSLFNKHDIHATWATVGMLFNKNWEEWEGNKPCQQPESINSELPAYNFVNKTDQNVIQGMCFAPELIYKITGCAGQEVGTNTYSHFYCQEQGQTPQQFKIDLEQAINLASQFDVNLKSLVFPRNQLKKEYLQICYELGIISVLGGYNKYYKGELNSRYTGIIPKFLQGSFKSLNTTFLSTSHDKTGNRFKLKKMLNAVNYESNFYYNIISLGYQAQGLEGILKDEYFEKDSLEHFKDQIGDRNKTLTDFRNIDKIISLEGDMLVKVDRTSMLTSLESRAPFLNKKLWNFTAQLPESYLMKGWNKKNLLKEALKKYFPEGFLDKFKKGFGVPVGDWLRGHLAPELKSHIEPDFLKGQNIFQKIKSLIWPIIIYRERKIILLGHGPFSASKNGISKHFCIFEQIGRREIIT